MRTSRAYLLAILCLAAVAAMLTVSVAQPPAASVTPETLRIAVCDIVEVFNNYQRARDLTAQLNERTAAIKAEDDKRGKAIEDLRLELENYKKGSDKFEQTVNEIQRLGIERKAYLEYQDALARREHLVLTKEMYKEIQAMIAQVARQRGAAVVLQRDTEEIQTENAVELVRQIYGRKLVYSADGLDISEQVLTALNQAYKTKAPAATRPR